jgi:predicted PurR-regulated permease PerM
MDKVDEGFCWVYWKLSYRRKFIRTLWMTPFVIAVIAFILFVQPYTWLSHTIPVIMSIVLVVIYVIQLMYTFHKWKRGN